MSLAGIIVTFALVDNVVLSRLLGLDHPAGAPGSLRAALAHGAAVGLLMGLGALAAWGMDVVALGPLGASFLRTPAYVFMVAGLAWVTARGAAAFAPGAARSLSFSDAALNSAALGVVLIVRRGAFGPGDSLVAGLAAGAGYALVLAVLASLRARLDMEEAPRAMRGLPLHLVSAGLVALVFLAFDRAFLARLVGG